MRREDQLFIYLEVFQIPRLLLQYYKFIEGIFWKSKQGSRQCPRTWEAERRATSGHGAGSTRLRRTGKSLNNDFWCSFCGLSFSRDFIYLEKRFCPSCEGFCESAGALWVTNGNPLSQSDGGAVRVEYLPPL